MASSDLIEIEPSYRAATFRDVPWRWGDVAIGLAPVAITFAFPLLLSLEIQYSLPRWLWIPLSMLGLGWMFAYPLWVARRRLGLPPLAGFRRVAIEAIIALPVVPVVMVIAAGVGFLLSRIMSQGSSTPFEAIAGAPEPYQAVALVIMAVGVAPLAEEVFFRGMFYNALRRRMHFVLAALLQGAVFGLSHPFSLPERLQIAVFGSCLALVYEWRKTLVSPILLHVLNNGLSMAALFYSIALAANAPVLGVRGDARETGCLITEVVPGGAAEEAGIRVGDVITGAGETPVKSLKDLVLIMRTKAVGDRIPVWFLREGELHQVEAVLKPRPK